MLYEDLIKGLELNNQLSTIPIENNQLSNPTEVVMPIQPLITTTEEPPLFTVEDFKQNLRTKSALSNKKFIDTSERLNAYDIVHSCIRNPIFRLLGTPIPDYSDNWLPVKLRSSFGSACHDFLQTNSACFTETEIYLRIPSINMSVKIDCLTGLNTLVEIKTCSYADYSKILKTNHARTEDFYQALLYRYLLEHHIDEAKSQDVDLKKYSLPKHDKYNITNIQMIYVCHELFSSDYNTLDQAVQESKELKRQLKSKYNTMWFIKVINYDLVKSNFDPHVEMIKDKINESNKFLQAKMVPTMDHKYVDPKKCFFCLYKNHCSTIP